VFGVVDEPPQALSSATPKTSLSRDEYLEAVRRIQSHIRKGELYQANLTQRFAIPFSGDHFELWSGLAAATPAPRAAFLSCDRFTLASVSPELFLRGEMDGRIETWPIKGTCRREPDPADDRLAAERLVASPKDNAELLMIVDLERNDLGRVCRTGSVRVPRIAALKSFPAVHHLQAVVQGVLERGTGFDQLLKAVFPGGSITGAPKESAMRLLEEIEPVPRHFYTGSLFWLGDDGSFDSSILIRSVVLTGGMAYLGAGGGIVADSDPEAEWVESCDKARALAGVLGFAPEEAF
jgi:para-aminobenzoate synthetase